MKTFDAARFKDTTYAKAPDKAKFANDFVRFAELDFPRTKFTKKFYQRMMFLFGHIAHYDIDGFYGTWFENDTAKLEFVRHALKHVPMGDPDWTWVDVERELQSWMFTTRLKEKYEDRLADSTEQFERAEYARLKAKYG